MSLSLPLPSLPSALSSLLSCIRPTDFLHTHSLHCTTHPLLYTTLNYTHTHYSKLHTHSLRHYLHSQTLAGLTSDQASAPSFVLALSKTLILSTRLYTEISPLAVSSFMNSSLTGVNISYSFSVTSGLTSEALITRFTNSVTSGLFLAVLKANSGLAISRLVMFDVHNLSPTAEPSAAPSLAPLIVEYPPSGKSERESYTVLYVLFSCTLSSFSILRLYAIAVTYSSTPFSPLLFSSLCYHNTHSTHIILLSTIILTELFFFSLFCLHCFFFPFFSLFFLYFSLQRDCGSRAGQCVWGDFNSLSNRSRMLL